ncbi:hypothetical protein QEN19_001898 [Hanseniaspora menglaensis]
MPLLNDPFDILDSNDLEEFKYLRAIKRFDYEQNKIKWNNQSAKQHLSYGRFELEVTHNLDRFRHIIERYIKNQNKTQISISFWLQYIDMEIRYGNYNHARNLFKRSIKLNRETNQFVLYVKYIELEHFLINMASEKHDLKPIFGIFKIWRSQIYFNDIELLNEFYKVYIKYSILLDKSQTIFNLRAAFMEWFVTTKSFTNWLEYEIQNNKSNQEIRSIFNLIIDELAKNGDKFCAFIISALEKYIFFEFNLNETNRVKALMELYYQYLGDDIVPLRLQHIFNTVSYSETHLIDSNNCKVTYFDERNRYFKNEADIHLSTFDESSYTSCYLFCIDYTNYLESTNDYKEYKLLVEKLKPQVNETVVTKSAQMKLYVKIFLKYLVFLELSQNIDNIWCDFIAFIQQFKNIRFKKVWIEYLKFLSKKEEHESLWKDTLKLIVTEHGKASIFKALIKQFYTENKFDEIRYVYNGFVTFNPFIENTWEEYIKLEIMLQDAPRVRSLYQSLITFFINSNEKLEQHTAFIIEQLKNFIDFETDEGEYNFVRNSIWSIYFLKQDSNLANIDFFKVHVQLWVDYAYWELKSPTQEQLVQYENNEDEEIQMSLTEENKGNCRSVFEAGLEFFKSDYNKKLSLLNQYINFEKLYGNDEHLVLKLNERLPIGGVFVDDNINEEDKNLDNLMNLVDEWEE